MSRKGKKQYQNKVIICKSSKFPKYLGIACIGLCIFIFGGLVSSLKFDYDSPESIMILLSLILIVSLFLKLSHTLITTKKELTINGSQLKINSNNKKYRFSSNLENMLWWRKIDAGAGGLYDSGDKIQIKFPSKTIVLSQLEFSNFYSLENYFNSFFPQKRRSKKP